MEDLYTDNICIALIDDSTGLRQAIGTYLGTHGFTVMLQAANGREFMTKITACPKLPDICLLDTNMPVMDGYATARQLKAKYPAMKIMAYSFFVDNDSGERMIACGADDYITKDASAIEVRDALRKLHLRP